MDYNTKSDCNLFYGVTSIGRYPGDFTFTHGMSDYNDYITKLVKTGEE